MTSLLARITTATAIAVMLEGCLTYVVAKDEPAPRTALILLGSEAVAGAGFGTVMYLIGDKIHRLPAVASVLVGVGVALVLDVAAAGVVAIANCDQQSAECKK